MSTPQTTLLMAVFDLEDMRTSRFGPSMILQYFDNESLNQSSLIGCLDAIATKVNFLTMSRNALTKSQIADNFVRQLGRLVTAHSLPPVVNDEVCKLLVGCTNRYRKVRETALRYASRLLQTFPSLMCDRRVVFTLLEILTLMRRSCELQYTDEVCLLIFKTYNRQLMLRSTHQCMTSSRTRWILL